MGNGRTSAAAVPDMAVIARLGSEPTPLAWEPVVACLAPTDARSTPARLIPGHPDPWWRLIGMAGLWFQAPLTASKLPVIVIVAVRGGNWCDQRLCLLVYCP